MTHTSILILSAALCALTPGLAASTACAQDIQFPLAVGAGLFEGEAGAVDEWEATPLAEDLRFDPSLVPAQLRAQVGGAAPRTLQRGAGGPIGLNRRTPARSAQLTRSAATLGLASIPFMIGDTGAGTCLAFNGIIEWEISHPTLSCSRLNISENNTAIPIDRGYFSYRHFHNAVNVRLFQFVDKFDTDRYTLGYERTFLDGMASVEIRAPFEARLRSDFVSGIVVDPPGPEGIADLVVPIGSGGETQLEAGNLSIIIKAKLIERERFILSGGLGVTAPTAPDVETGLALVGFPEVSFTNVPGILAQSAGSSFFEFENEIVYLSPFLAWAHAGEGGKWFHQGFLQVEAAANRASFTGAGGYDNIFTDLARNPIGVASYVIEPGFIGRLQAQTLMRLNLGVGRVLVDRPRGDWLQRLYGLAELHYTTTLEDATFTDIPLIETLNAGVTLPLELEVGNQANRVDILNAALGLSAEVRAWTITNGFVAPLRSAPDRGFDFEYNLQAQRVF